MHVVTRTQRRASDASRRRRRAALGFAAALLAIAAGPAVASAELAITAPFGGSYTNDTSPTFAGTTLPAGSPLEACEVEVDLYAGPTPGGPLVQEPLKTLGCSWLTAPAATLEQGVYTALAHATRDTEDGELVSEASAPVSFTVDTTPPVVAIGSPSPGAVPPSESVAVSGSSQMAPGDLPSVTVQVFPGASAEGTPIEAIELPVAAGAWSGTVAGLAPGSYTLRAEQQDAAGNVGSSAPVVVSVPAPKPPVASFAWFPASPQVGEAVSLVSSSTDAESPITGFAWALGPDAPAPGRPTLTTSFATAGPHVVRLQVTDAAGRSSEVAETIAVRHRRSTLMQPFPIVRIAGRETGAGVRLTLLTVTAPVSSRVTVEVRGRGGRTSTQSRVATVRKPGSGGTVLMAFPRFARSLPTGSTLEVRVTKAGEIGKLTRFVPHHGKLPTRTDRCLSATGTAMICPAS